MTEKIPPPSHIVNLAEAVRENVSSRAQQRQPSSLMQSISAAITLLGPVAVYVGLFTSMVLLEGLGFQLGAELGANRAIMILVISVLNVIVAGALVVLTRTNKLPSARIRITETTWLGSLKVSILAILLHLSQQFLTGHVSYGRIGHWVDWRVQPEYFILELSLVLFLFPALAYYMYAAQPPKHTPVISIKN